MAQATFRISHNYCISLHKEVCVLPNTLKKLWSLVCLDEHLPLHCVKWNNVKDLYKNLAIVLTKSYIAVKLLIPGNKTIWVSDMFYSTPCSCKCIFIFVRIDIHAYIGGLQRLNTQRDCITNCALRGLAHRNFSSQVLMIRALYDAFEIVISRIVTFPKSYRNCLVSLDLRSTFEIVTPGLHPQRSSLNFLPHSRAKHNCIW